MSYNDFKVSDRVVWISTDVLSVLVGQKATVAEIREQAGMVYVVVDWDDGDALARFDFNRAGGWYPSRFKLLDERIERIEVGDTVTVTRHDKQVEVLAMFDWNGTSWLITTPIKTAGIRTPIIRTRAEVASVRPFVVGRRYRSRHGDTFKLLHIFSNGNLLALDEGEQLSERSPDTDLYTEVPE